jgi:hypothetical protein
MSLHSARGTSPLCASILCQCAPTLENLIWRTTGAAGNDPQTLGTDLSRIPSFPKLRRFELDDSVVFADAQTLNSPIGGLLEAPIRYLVANTGPGYEGHGKIRETCFRDRGCMPTLETFVWTHAELRDEHSLDFLIDNPHLRRLSMPGAIAPLGEIEGKLLPLLVANFRYLTSLDLSWQLVRHQNEHISFAELEKISEITTLENLQISGYDRRPGGRLRWIPNHEKLREKLSPLHRLKKFSIADEFYIYEDKNGGVYMINPNSSPERFPSTIEKETRTAIARFTKQPLTAGTLPLDNFVGNAAVIYDNFHLPAMIAQVRKYRDTFPMLDWIYVGQLQFGLRLMALSMRPAARFITLISECRESCIKLRRDIFGNPDGW